MATTKWSLDPTHSELQFKVKHLMITTVTGKLKDISGTIEAEDDNFEQAQVHFSADLSSIDTANADRDNHLKGADFFDIEKYPTITFKSTAFVKKGDDYQLTGDLTIREVTRPVSLNVEFGGIAKDPWGNVKAGFTINGKINRTDFGLSWNAALETGGVLVSEDVRIQGEVQYTKQA